MPRAKRRIPRATVGQGRTLTAPAEWELSIFGGLAIPGVGFDDQRDFDSAWRQYRDTILPAWIAQVPGSRPFGAYVTGEIPLPPLVVDPHPHDAGRQIGSTTYYDARCYGIGDVDELEYLVEIGVVDPDEERAGRQRIDEHGTRCLYSWQHVTEH
jgi:hypothetical protein